MLISIVIPTYNEDKIYQTLEHLIQQTIFQKYQIEILLANFDPENNQSVLKQWIKFQKDYPDIYCSMKDVDRKGISYARHHGIVASSGEIIVNFDADARFSRNDGLEKLVEPIIKKECMITCCDNLLDNSEFNADLSTRVTGVAAYELLNFIQREALIVTFESGFCFTKYSYEYTGGFNDVKQAEAIIFSPRLIYNFGLFCKRHIPNVEVIASPRRINAMSKVGLLNALNYDNAFRPS